jgi:WD40 repeat protein
VRFVDLASGRVRTGAGRHEDRVVSAVFSADGRRAVTAGADNRVMVWDVARGVPTDTLEGQTGSITGVAISLDGRTLYTAALAGQVVVWDLAGARRLGRPLALGPTAPEAGGPVGFGFPHAVSPDGPELVAAMRDGTVKAMDIRTLRPLFRSRPVAGGQITALAFVPHGGPLAVGVLDGPLTLLEPRRGGLVQRIPAGPGGVTAISFSADGRAMVTHSLDDGVQLWTLRAGRVVGHPRAYRPSFIIEDASLSPDGRRLAMLTAVGIQVVDTASLRRPALVKGTGTVHHLGGFTPDGRSIAGAGDHWARLWSATTLEPVTRPLRGGASSALLWPAISPDGRSLATGGADGTVRLFDLPSQQPLGAPLPAVPNHAAMPMFTSDGAYLLVVADTGAAYRWDVRPATWERQACAVAGRTLTRAEWAEALGGRPYAPACAR